MFIMLDFIECKRDGSIHSADDIRSFVRAVRDDMVPDYQVAAWLMAVFLNGLSDEELVVFTDAIARSGDVVSFPEGVLVVDKHSTGGVGDKTTFIVTPVAAACGVKVAKLSGRALGFTGGTVDKMDSLYGTDMHLSAGQFVEQIMRIGIAITGHSLDLAPAEARFYNLRDVTGTVPSLPLIASSIVSKKIAGGAGAFVFDVKCGSGGFMQTMPEAEALSRALVTLSKALGKRSVCVISDMNQPLGEWIGNSVEVAEAMDVLAGKGPNDTRTLSLRLASEMILMGGITDDMTTASELAEEALESGRALDKFAELITAQGGDAKVCRDPWGLLDVAVFTEGIRAEASGVVEQLDARLIGRAVRMIGGGRVKKSDAIDTAVGIRVIKKIGSAVEKGDLLAEIYYNSESMLSETSACVKSAFKIGSGLPTVPLILGRVE